MNTPRLDLYRTRLVVVLFALALLIRLPLAFRPLYYGPGGDAWRQADTASIARFFYREDYRLFMPQVYWGGDGPGYVETEFQLFPFLTALLYAPFGEQVWLGRLVSLAMTIPALWAVYQLTRRVAGERAAIGALLFAAISPLSIRYSVAFMPEATAFCFYALALDLFYRWLDEPRTRLLVAAGICTALAILVKPTAIQIGLVFLLLLVARFRLRWVAEWTIWLFAALCLLPNIAWYLHARDLYLTYGNTFGILSGGDSKFGDLATWLSPGFYYQLARLEITWVFAGAGALVSGYGLVVLIRQKQARLVLMGLVTTLLYYMIVARYARQPWGIQYHIYIIPYAAITFGAGLSALFEHSAAHLSQHIWLAAVGGLLALIALGVVYVTADLFRPANKALASCGEYVATIVPQDTLIIVSTTSLADIEGTPNNYQEPDLFFYSDRRGWSLPADQHDPGRLDEFRERGAAYFVMTSQSLYEQNPDLATYLETHSDTISGFESSCAVFALRAEEARSEDQASSRYDLSGRGAIMQIGS